MRRSSLLPEGAAYALDMGHRFLSAAVGVLLVGSAIMLLRRGVHASGLISTARLVIVALAGQKLPCAPDGPRARPAGSAAF